jgi:hypothetical protein
MEGGGIIADQTWQLDVPGGKGGRREFTGARLPEKIGEGQHVFVMSGATIEQPDESDSFIAVELE